MKLGFIGLGRMGAGMASNLVKAGHEVTVYSAGQPLHVRRQAAGKHYLGYAGPAGEAPNVISVEARTATLRYTDYVWDLNQDVEVIYYFVDVCYLVEVEQRIAVGIIEGDSKSRDAPACSDQLHHHVPTPRAADAT